MKPSLKTLGSGHWPSLLGAWLHFEVSFMVWLLIGAMGIAIAGEFGLTATQKGVLVAIPILGGALLRIPVGLASDIIGPKRTGLVLLLAQVAALIWGWGGATTYAELLGVGLCLGVAGASFAVALPIASRAYPPQNQGLAMGVAASANSGTVLSVFFAPRLAELVGWHAVFGLALFPVVLTFFLFIWLVREQPADRNGGLWSTWPQAVEEVFKSPSIYWFCLVYAVSFGGFVGLCSFLPIFLHDQYGLNLIAAGSVAAVCGLAGSLVRPFGGYLADRRNPLRILFGMFIGIALMGVVLARLLPIHWAAPALAGAVTLMGCGNGVIFRLVSDRFRHQMGLASGVIGAAGALGGFLLPSWLGLLKDITGTYRSGFLLLGGVGILAAFSVVLAIRRERQGTGPMLDMGGILR